MKFTKRSRGFTLIEIVIVITIMAVFTTIIYSSFGVSKANSRDQKRVSDISSIQLALEQYFQKNGKYPQTLNTLVPTYISAIPTDPTNSTNDYINNYFPITKIMSSDKCISYQLWTIFENKNAYLDTKKGFDSNTLLSGYYECGNGHQKIVAASQPLVFDVMP